MHNANFAQCRHFTIHNTTVYSVGVVGVNPLTFDYHVMLTANRYWPLSLRAVTLSYVLNSFIHKIAVYYEPPVVTTLWTSKNS